MITGLLVAPLLFVDDAAACQFQQFITQIDVVDAPAAVPVPGSSAVVPPAPVATVGFEDPEDILQPVTESGLECLALG